jgi:nitrogenase iron protein NifH
MAIYAANNLFRGIQSYSNTGGALLGGVIANSINTPFHRDILDDFVERTHTKIMEYIPRSLTVTQSELQGKTTIEAAPDSEQADIYRRLADRIAKHTKSTVPSPLSSSELRTWSASWATQLIENERAQQAPESVYAGVNDDN